MSLKVSLDNATFDNGLLADNTRFNTQLQFSGLIDTEDFIDDVVAEMPLGLNLFSAGMVYDPSGEQFHAQLTGPWLQTPLLFRLESGTYTFGLGGLF